GLVSDRRAVAVHGSASTYAEALSLGRRRRGAHQENEKKGSADHVFPHRAGLVYQEDTLLL
ncbi:MAG TPA: hypothetical protein VGA84_16390, partial [Thermoanaerobaculia bacterium]